MHTLRTLQDLVKSFKNYGNSPFISWKEDGKTKRLSYADANELINAYSRGFLEIGLKPKDKVAIFSCNIPMWCVLTLSLNNAGLIDVPRGHDSEPDEINYILEHSKAKIAIVEDQNILEKFEKYKHRDLELVLSINKLPGIRMYLR